MQPRGDHGSAFIQATAPNDPLSAHVCNPSESHLTEDAAPTPFQACRCGHLTSSNWNSRQAMRLSCRVSRTQALHPQDLISLAVLVMSPHVQVQDARPSLSESFPLIRLPLNPSRVRWPIFIVFSGKVVIVNRLLHSLKCSSLADKDSPRPVCT